MALPVVYRRKVGRDLAGGFGWYEGQGEGLGEKFLAPVDATFDAIERYGFRASTVKYVAPSCHAFLTRSSTVWNQNASSS